MVACSALEEGKEKTKTQNSDPMETNPAHTPTSTSTAFSALTDSLLPLWRPFLPPSPVSFPLSSSQGASAELAVVTRLMDDSESGMEGVGEDRETRPLSSLQSLYGHVLCQIHTNHKKAALHTVYL